MLPLQPFSSPAPSKKAIKLRPLLAEYQRIVRKEKLSVCLKMEVSKQPLSFDFYHFLAKEFYYSKKKEHIFGHLFFPRLVSDETSRKLCKCTN